MSFPRTLILLAVIALAPFAGAAQAQEPADGTQGYQGYTVQEARLLGMAALESGRPDIAYRIAQSLLARDPEDAYAHFLMATALMRAGQIEGAQAAARQAFRHARTPQQRYQAARLTAVAAYNREHFGRAQWWLRRAADAAPGAEERDLSLRAFRNVRTRNPWQVDLRFSANPSNNVNNGASSEYNIIDGVPVVGWISPDGQALSGVISEARAEVGYRFRRSAASETHVAGAFGLRRVDLSRSARDRAPGLDPRIFDTRRAELSLRHLFRPGSGPHILSMEGGAGRQWAQDGRDYSFARAGLGWRRMVGARTMTGLAAALETREATGNQTRGDTVYSLQGSVVRALGNGDVLTGAVYLSGHRTQFDGRSSRTLGGYLAYEPARDFGPVRLSGMLSVGRTDFPGYAIGIIPVPGGRRDDTYSAALNLSFPQVSYAGFAPVATLRMVRTRSNVSRFDTSQTGVTLALRSQF